MKELLDIKLLKLYKVGERNFCNYRLHNSQPRIALGGALVGYCHANFKNENYKAVLSKSKVNQVSNIYQIRAKAVIP